MKNNGGSCAATGEREKGEDQGDAREFLLPVCVVLSHWPD